MGDVTMTESAYNKLRDTVDKAKKVIAEKGAAAIEKVNAAADKVEEKVNAGLFHVAGAHAEVVQSLLTGGLVFYVMTGDWFDKIKAFKEHWWLRGLVVLGVGYWMFRRRSSWAAGILATGAALLVHGYNTRPKEEKKDDKNKADANKGDTNKKDASTQDTKGFDEAGGWDWQDTYGRHGRWVETPHGARAYMTEGPGAYAAERMVDSVFAHG